MENKKRYWIIFKDVDGNEWSLVYHPLLDGPVEKYINNSYYKVREEDIIYDNN